LIAVMCGLSMFRRVAKAMGVSVEKLVAARKKP
jgi:hypothetical protein